MEIRQLVTFKMGMVNSALSALPEQKMFDKLRKLSSGALGTVGKTKTAATASEAEKETSRS